MKRKPWGDCSETARDVVMIGLKFDLAAARLWLQKAPSKALAKIQMQNIEAYRAAIALLKRAAQMDGDGR